MTDFDEVAYPGYPYIETHPDRLSLLGRVHGLRPADPDDCRVLEVGCGDGLNLVGMAAGVPGLRGLGIDLAAGPLERGRAVVEALGIGDRVRLEAMDVRDAGPGLGTFDYVVAHGVYSWTPPEVRDATLALCRAVLAPHGIAFMSFVAHPGGHLRTLVREIGLLAGRRETGVRRRAARAQELYAALAPLVEGRALPYAQVVAEHLEWMTPRPLSALVHDELAGDYQAFWLVDVVEHAARRGLRRLCEADVQELRADWMPPEIAARLDQIAGGDPLMADQLADVVAGRAYREAILCRDDAPAEAAPCERGVVGLLTGEERVPVDEAGAADALAAFRAGRLRLHAAPARWAAQPGERPEAFPLARLQARDQEGVTNLRHQYVRLAHPVAQRLLTLLDGTRTRAEIAAALAETVDEPLRAGLAAGLDRSLQGFADQALLVR